MSKLWLLLLLLVTTVLQAKSFSNPEKYVINGQEFSGSRILYADMVKKMGLSVDDELPGCVASYDYPDAMFLSDDDPKQPNATVWVARLSLKNPRNEAVFPDFTLNSRTTLDFLKRQGAQRVSDGYNSGRYTEKGLLIYRIYIDSIDGQQIDAYAWYFKFKNNRLREINLWTQVC